jgi:hypothetical protein
MADKKRDHYIMPVDLTITLENGTEQIFTLLNSAKQQRFQLQTESMPSAVQFDKDINILREIDETASLPNDNILPTARTIFIPLGKKSPLKVLLLGRGRDEDGTVKEYQWIIDNKKIIDGRFAIATLEKPGSHQIFMTVFDDNEGAGSSVPYILNIN